MSHVAFPFDIPNLSDSHKLESRRFRSLPCCRLSSNTTRTRRAQTRMRKLESLRLDVDARRRRVHMRYMRALERMERREAQGQGGASRRRGESLGVARAIGHALLAAHLCETIG